MQDNVKYYKNPILLETPRFDFSQMMSGIRLVSAHQGLKWVALVDAYDKSLNEIKRL